MGLSRQKLQVGMETQDDELVKYSLSQGREHVQNREKGKFHKMDDGDKKHSYLS